MNVYAVMCDAWNVAPDVLTATERLVLLRLAFHANAAGTSVFPSVESLMRHTGAKRRSVQMALRRLEELEFVTTEQAAHGQQTPRRKLNLETIREAGLADERGAEIAPLPTGAEREGRKKLHRGAQKTASRGAKIAPKETGSKKARRNKVYANGSMESVTTVVVSTTSGTNSRSKPDGWSDDDWAAHCSEFDAQKQEQAGNLD